MSRKVPASHASRRQVRGGGGGRHPADSRAIRPAPGVFRSLFGFTGNVKSESSTERPKTGGWFGKKTPGPGRQDGSFYDRDDW
jgi:hypothetical protein